ncbi:hypothetical protein GPX89_15225 [Nocardia sp. ET3-3]|uniref:PucR C-terminal helix-turn-helix domain-containing protein n=1 Tax=Nocardia terrae TaxID=2675851 RepID=A0A7K1UW42_9NOCA|nr:helix-turn-helix domain-containing protein [Nocardia terrae]MVU78594.1 hypothetical protein [Nocardia terrae]
MREIGAARSRLVSIGLEPDVRYHAVLVSSTNTAYASTIAMDLLDDVAQQWNRSSVPIEMDGGYLMLVPATADDQEDELVVCLEAAADRIRPLLGRGWVSIGTSGPAPDPSNLLRAIDDARHTHRIATVRSGSLRSATSSDLSPRLTLLSFVPKDMRILFRNRLIGVLEDYDREHRTELVDTLAAFLDASGSWSRCAARLHVHVNTLRYRLQRIEALTGRDLAELPDRLDFYLALRCLQEEFA